MKSIPRRIFPAFVAAVVLSVVASVASAQVRFPPGVDWSTATPDQIASAVFEAVQRDPDAAVSIVQSTIQSVSDTGRYPQGFAGGKQDDDPDRPPTLEDIAVIVAQAATRANPSAAAAIAAAVAGMVPTAALDVAKAVAAVAPEASKEIGQAVLEVVPSLDPVLVDQSVNEGVVSGDTGGGGDPGSGAGGNQPGGNLPSGGGGGGSGGGGAPEPTPTPVPRPTPAPPGPYGR